MSSFDEFSKNYDEALNQGLSVSGEDKTYFAQGRIHWLQQRLTEIEFQPKTVLDFGTGTGTSVLYFLVWPQVTRVTGVDPSPQSISVAKTLTEDTRAQFLVREELPSAASFDLAFCNGVFHHIKPEDRLNEAKFVLERLRPGGIFAFWENNPWNPGTRYVMSRIPFDRDAKTLSIFEARKLLKEAGFKLLRQDFLFIFPGFLKILRGLERSLSSLPLGAQYLVLAQKGEASGN